MTESAREPLVEVRSGAATDPGRLRAHNEDSYWSARPVFLVADGMGGHTRGDAASAEVVRQFSQIAGPWTDAEQIRRALASAAANISALAAEGRAPGTTLTGVALTQQSGRPYWLVFNVGDSRTYLLRDNALEQVSVDHSRRQELIDLGMEKQSITVGHNIITRALGGGLSGVPALDQWLLPLQAGDRLLLCSDGLSGELTPMLMAAMMRTLHDPDEAARALVNAAVTASGRDNVTAVIVDAVSVEIGSDEVDDTVTELSADDADTDREEDPWVRRRALEWGED